MTIRMAGIDHTRAGLDVRSVFSLTKSQMEKAYADWKELPWLDGCVILSTCNRMELWMNTDEHIPLSPAEMLCRYLGADEAAYLPYFVQRSGREAVEHLFRLAAGLESLIIGEDQILTQVGDALAFSRGFYAAGHTLEVLFRQAVTAGKRVKTEGNLSSADRSVIHAALEALRAREGFSVRGKPCMVIGNGMMGKLAAQTLREQGADVTVTVRRYHNGVVDVPEGCRRIGYEDRLSLLPDCDLVVSATASPNFTLTREALAPLNVERRIYLLDLAVPRDIEPEAGELPWVRLYDIDAFHIDPRSEALRRGIEKAEAILREEEDVFYNWLSGADLVPRIRRITDLSGVDVRGRMTPALRRARLDDQQRTALAGEVEAASGRMMNHLLFELRARLPEEEFRDCLSAIEFVLNEN